MPIHFGTVYVWIAIHLAKLPGRIQNQNTIPCSLQVTTYPFLSLLMGSLRAEHISSATIDYVGQMSGQVRPARYSIIPTTLLSELSSVRFSIFILDQRRAFGWNPFALNRSMIQAQRLSNKVYQPILSHLKQSRIGITF